jgi:hypothetical protein
MSRYIVEYCVTCGIVICGYPHCLNEIHILRIQHIPLCLVNPQIRLRHLWTVPCFNYKHMIFVPKWASVCVCVWYILGPSIEIPTLQDVRFSQLFMRILLLSTSISMDKRSMDPPAQGPTQFLPAVAASVFSGRHLRHCTLPVTLPVFHVMCLLGKLFRHHKLCTNKDKQFTLP